MWSGRVSPATLRKGKGKLANLQQRDRRGARSESFPVAARNLTAEEVKAYFAGDLITCLLCGKSFQTLARHLRMIHGVSGDQYRERYGLPFRLGLASAKARAEHSARLSTPENIERMRERGSRYRHLGHEAVRQRGMRRPAYAADLTTKRALAMNGLDQRYQAADFDAFLQHTLTGMIARDVAALPNTPSVSAWNHFRRDNPDFDRRVREAWEVAPFAVQARLQLLGPRFKAEVERLLREGLSQYQVAERLGVSQAKISNVKTGHQYRNSFVS
jgi:predicted transcriptional regulator